MMALSTVLVTFRRGWVVVACVALLGGPLTAAAQAQSSARPISATWRDAPIRNVIGAFAAFSGKSIVLSPGVSGLVTADINAQPWDVALRSILLAHGLLATEDEYGIIRVGAMAEVSAQETIEPIVTRTYRISFVPAAEIQATVEPLLSDRGSVSAVPSRNVIIVSDVARVQRVIAGLLR